MLQLINVSKTYRSKKQKVVAIKDVSLNLPSKGLVFITGKSGSGKTTLLNLIGGIDFCDSGNILVDGKDFKSYKFKDYDSYRNSLVGYVFQNFLLFDDYTVKDNISLSLQLQGINSNVDEVKMILDQVDLNELIDRKVNELSGGQMQRVAIARALIKKPKIILADEPSGNLDSKTGEQIYELLKELSKDRLIVVVSHDQYFTEKYADRIIMLKDGVIVDDRSNTNLDNKVDANIKLIKSKLPLRFALKLGIQGFRQNVFKMLLTIILSMLAIFSLSFSYMAKSFNENDLWIDLVYRSNVDYVTLKSKESHQEIPFSKTEEIKDKYNNLGYEISSILLNRMTRLNIYDEYVVNDEPVYYDLAPYGLLQLNDDLATRMEERLTPNSRMPENVGEILITNYYVEVFKKYGYRPFDHTIDYGLEDETRNTRVEVINDEDMLGKRLDFRSIGYGTALIVGIVEYDINEYEMFKDLKINETVGNPNEFSQKIADFSQTRLYYLNYIMVHKDYNLYHVRNNLLTLTLPHDRNDLATLKDMLFEDGISLISSFDLAYAWVIPNIKSTSTLATILGSFFLVNALLLIFNFIKKTIEKDYKKIGILRAMGAKNFDVLKIYLCQNLMWILLLGILTIPTMYLAEYSGNRIYTSMYPFHVFGQYTFLKVLSFNKDTFLLILAGCSVSIILATIVPIIELARLKPITILKKKG